MCESLLSRLTSSTDNVVYGETDGTWKTRNGDQTCCKSNCRFLQFSQSNCRTAGKQLHNCSVFKPKDLIIRQTLLALAHSNQLNFTLTTFCLQSSFVWSPHSPRLLTETSLQPLRKHPHLGETFGGICNCKFAWRSNCQFARISIVFFLDLDYCY